MTLPLLAALLLAPAPLPACAVPGPWKMTFGDEFDGDAVDRRNWNAEWREFDDKGRIFYQPYRFGAVNKKENLKVADGVLTIRVAQEGVDWDPKVKHTTGVLNSAERFSQAYGVFEARIKAPSPRARGIDAAFWLFPEANAWPPEIDVVETPASGEARKVLQNLHYKGPAGENLSVEKYVELPAGEDFHAKWHTFSVVWEPGRIAWYVDRKLTHEVREHVPSEPMVLFLSPEIQGGWCGDPALGEWPQTMQVDHVRVWERPAKGR